MASTSNPTLQPPTADSDEGVYEREKRQMHVRHTVEEANFEFEWLLRRRRPLAEIRDGLQRYRTLCNDERAMPRHALSHLFDARGCDARRRRQKQQQDNIDGGDVGGELLRYKLEVATYLLENGGADVSEEYEKHEPVFFAVMRTKHVPLVELFLKHGAPTYSDHHRMSPPRMVALECGLEIFKLFFGGGKVRATDLIQLFPSALEHLDCAEFLLSLPSHKIRGVKGDKCTGGDLLRAYLCGGETITCSLVYKLCRLPVTLCGDYFVQLDWVLRRGADVNSFFFGNHGETKTLTLYAAEAQRWDVVRWLIERGGVMESRLHKYTCSLIAGRRLCNERTLRHHQPTWETCCKCLCNNEPVKRFELSPSSDSIIEVV